MFVQHHLPLSPALSTNLVIQSPDFELYVQEKTQQKLKGTIQFQYLNQTFKAAIVITAHTIQIKSQQAFSGIRLNAPTSSTIELANNSYLLNDTISKQGHQQIIWLLLDFIHLFNVLRLKPGDILELYRATFKLVKNQNRELVFGKIDTNAPIAKQLANNLHQQWKRKLKYELSNAKDLLANVQDLLANYPLQFTQAKKAVQKACVLS
jgi:hypothetical protein